MTFADPIRLSYLVAGVIALAGVAWPFPGSIFIATAILAIGQLWTSLAKPYWVRASFFLALGLALTFIQGTTAVKTMPFSADIPLILGVIASTLLLFFGDNRNRAIVISLICLGSGIFFSAQDADGGSVYWRGAILAKKAFGGLPQVSWSDAARETFGTRVGFKHIDVDRWIEVIDRKPGPNGDIELFRTQLGDMWAPAVNRESVALIVQEMVEIDEYQIDDQRIRPGDVVIDCGGHVGFYTKLALRQGASLVVAFEPDPENHWLYSQNLKQEIADGRVQLVQAGVWNERDELVFHHSTTNPGAHGFFGHDGEDMLVQNVPVVPLDEKVEEFGLDRVDWIKMDIEGAEPRALQGAARTLAKFKPNLAICTYHGEDDPEAIPPIVLAANPEYVVSAKHVAANGSVRPKVLFFR